jgi:tetratricopeptide (TPR) repeat protein
MSKVTVCLNMIVKNEAHVIERCLASAKPLVDRWCIVDTGSTDGTQNIIRAFMNGVPGSLHERAWKNFAHNRNEALDLARIEACNYVLFIDADETFEAPHDFVWPALAADGYELTAHYDAMRYARAAMVATRLPWRWNGVLHEYLDCTTPHRVEALAAPTILVRHDGARSRDPSTYLKDIAVLEAALRDEPGNTRNVFYLAQSYRDAGKLSDARTTYERRATMGGWDEEIWHSLFQVAVLTERLGDTPEKVASAYLRAFAQRPSRAEPLVELARFHRLRAEHAQGYLYAKHASEMTRPADRLFVDEATYAWRALDELAISAYYVGTGEARRCGSAAVELLMASAAVPVQERDRIATNAKYYVTADR